MHLHLRFMFTLSGILDEVVGKNWTRIEGFFGGFFIVNNVQNTQKIQLGLQGESGH